MKLAKGMLVGLTGLWLVGCASNSQIEESTNAQLTETVPAPEAQTMPIVDPAVQAVINSGKVQGTQEEITKLLGENTVRFGYDSDKLTAQDAAVLDVQAAYLTSPAGLAEKIVIEGHTDERGTRTYNLALGERRALAVKKYLTLKGVAASRIEVVSYGFEKPLNMAHNEQAWKENRRAVVIKEG